MQRLESQLEAALARIERLEAGGGGEEEEEEEEVICEGLSWVWQSMFFLGSLPLPCTEIMFGLTASYWWKDLGKSVMGFSLACGLLFSFSAPWSLPLQKAYIWISVPGIASVDSSTLLMKAHSAFGSIAVPSNCS